ncbi:sugar transferase [Akkermansiaceae bacterium]|nr:sugar transferase [Akkermansiaceae bacterium]
MIYKYVKRLFDLVCSGAAITLLSPLMIPIIVGLRFTGEGYIFYKQERVGYKNRPFLIWKFATMLKDSPNMDGGLVTTSGDPRITPMGGFLRKSKINELPQLFNILFGHMSIVGPRPLATKMFALYDKKIQSRIYNVKPGLTGIGSILFRDEELIVSSLKSEEPLDYVKRVIAPYKGELEMWYQSNRSVFLDCQLIFMTAWVILSPTSKLYEKWFRDLPERDF